MSLQQLQDARAGDINLEVIIMETIFKAMEMDVVPEESVQVREKQRPRLEPYGGPAVRPRAGEQTRQRAPAGSRLRGTRVARGRSRDPRLASLEVARAWQSSRHRAVGRVQPTWRRRGGNGR